MKKELSKREKEIIGLISKGLISDEIAKELGISTRTVDAHRSNAMQKTGANNSAHLIMICIERGKLLMQRCANVRYVPESDIEACKN